MYTPLIENDVHLWRWNEIPSSFDENSLHTFLKRPRLLWMIAVTPNAKRVDTPKKIAKPTLTKRMLYVLKNNMISNNPIIIRKYIPFEQKSEQKTVSSEDLMRNLWRTFRWKQMFTLLSKTLLTGSRVSSISSQKRFHTDWLIRLRWIMG